MAPVSERSEAPLAILGCGAVGGALAAALRARGHTPRLWSRRPERARMLAARLLEMDPAGAAVERLSSPAEALGEAGGIALLCVADDVLGDFAQRLAREASPAEGATAVHVCGAAGLEVLEPLAQRGVGVARLHPLVALPPAAPDLAVVAASLTGAWFVTAADGEGETALEQVLGLLGGRPWRLPGDDRTARTVHAAAALVSGGTVALFDMALEVLAALEGDGGAEAGHAALLGLLRGTLGNVERVGARAALTGPVARGAAGVVHAHLERLDGAEGEAGALYRLLGRRMLRLALERGSVESGEAEALGRLLAGPGYPPA